MFEYGRRIAEARIAKGWSQTDLAKRIGTTQQQVARYESGENDVKSSIIVKMSAALGVTISYLLGLDETPQDRCKTARVVPADASLPYVGRIAAGTPREAVEMDGERRWASPDVVGEHPHAFFLRASGDSMNLVLPDGCMVAIDPDECEVVNGRIYAVLVNGCDATIKQVFRVGSNLVLHPLSSNPEHRDRVVGVDDPDAPYFRIVGRAVWYVGEPL